MIPRAVTAKIAAKMTALDQKFAVRIPPKRPQPRDYYPYIRRYFHIYHTVAYTHVYVKVYCRSGTIYSVDTREGTHRTLDELDAYCAKVYLENLRGVLSCLPQPIAEEIQAHV